MLENSSQFFAVIGSVALVVSLVLAIRSSVLDKIFQGLNTSLKYHHWAGIIGVVLVVIHGAIEAFSLGVSLQDLKNQLQDPWILSGWLSALIFLFATFQSRRVTWAHKKWRRVHLLMLPALGLATAHAIYFSEYRRIAIFLALLSGLAIIRSQVLPRLPFWGRKYRVVRVRNLNQRSFELIISPVRSNGKLPIEVAQYFYLRFRSKGLSTAWHPFTCISPLNSDDLKFAIKALGQDTRMIEKLPIGSDVDIEGPYGHFHTKTNLNEVWIVGGVGITPLLSWAQDLAFQNTKVRALYSVDHVGDAIYLVQLEKLKQRNTNFNLDVWESDKYGFVSLPKLKTIVEEFENATFFIAGPILFIRHIKRLLKSLNVSAQQIHSEEFIK